MAFYFLFHFALPFITVLTYIVIYFLGITLSMIPRSRLLINPPIEYTLEFEEWYIVVVHVNMWTPIISFFLKKNIELCSVVFYACDRWADDGHAQWRLQFIRLRRLWIPILEIPLPRESCLTNTLPCIMCHLLHNIVLDFLYYFLYNPFWQLLT